VLNKLKSIGHKLRVLKKTEGIGNAHGLTIEYDTEGNPVRFFGGTDPRGGGKAAGPKKKK
jgi:gamma-glutamyltranspeptidase